MTIRTKLAASVSLLLLATAGAMSLGVLVVVRSFRERDVDRRARVVERSVERAAMDALIQKDDLALVSNVTFVRSLYPELLYVRMTWQSGLRERSLVVGEAAGSNRAQEKGMTILDPRDSSRRVVLTIGVDRTSLGRNVREQDAGLTKMLLLVAALTLAAGVVFSVWFARTVTAPLAALVRLAGEIGEGRLGAQLEWSSDDELGALVGVFNRTSLRLAEADEAKKRFVSSVTHELRSPLGAIESFLHLVQEQLKSGKATPQTAEYLGRIDANVKRLGGFINDLLDVAKIEKGKMECSLRPMKVQDVAADVCRFFEAKARLQGVSLAQDLGALPAVEGDPERLRQVLVNLISNSLKFTAKGGEVRLSGRRAAAGWAEVTVSDSGRGMDNADAARLFAPFSQGANVKAGVAGPMGTGLGLFIVKSIVEQHGGEVSLTSAPGRGTSVKFSLKEAA